MSKPDDDWKAESEERFWMEYDHQHNRKMYGKWQDEQFDKWSAGTHKKPTLTSFLISFLVVTIIRLICC